MPPFRGRVKATHESQRPLERRELSYESDVLGAIDWDAIDPAKLARGWSPAAAGLQEQRLRIGLEVVDEAVFMQRVNDSFIEFRLHPQPFGLLDRPPAARRARDRVQLVSEFTQFGWLSVRGRR